MKVAIIQEWLTSIGGSDKVVRSIIDLFPDAHIFTIVSRRDVCEELGVDYSKVHNSFIQKLPFGVSKYRSYLPIMPYAIEQFDVSDFDIIISSSHAVAKGVITKSTQLHICYCHSPIRYAWDLYHQYLNDSGLKNGLIGFIAKYFLHRIRLWDVLSSNRVDEFVSNSDYVGKRIKKIYRRNSTTIYPGVDVDSFDVDEKKYEYYLACSRLVSYKKIDLIVKAFNQLPDKKLKVIGDGPEYKKIKALSGPNIELLGYQKKESLIYHLQKARAFVFAADEDFGIIPVEAQACGTPVIALGVGGALETVINNRTGIFFYEQTEEAIIKAIHAFEKIQFDYTEIRKNSERFSEKRFKNEFYSFVLSKYKEFKDQK